MYIVRKPDTKWKCRLRAFWKKWGSPSPSDEIHVTGSKVKQDSADLILAREVVKGGDSVTLRFGPVTPPGK